MSDAEQYNKELAIIMGETESNARRAQTLSAKEGVRDLLKRANAVGINTTQAHDVFMSAPDGLERLEAEIVRRKSRLP